MPLDFTVIFDLDETLVVETVSVKTTFANTCAFARDRFGIDPERLEQAVRSRASAAWHVSPVYPYCRQVGISSWEGLWGKFTGDDANLEYLRGWISEYRRRAWTEGLNDLGINDGDFGSMLADIFVHERGKHHIAFADAEPVLQSLYGRYKLGIITNGTPDIQQEKIDRTGLGHYFDTIVISGQVGTGKPHPKIFLLALSQLRAAPSQTVMIGDNIKYDVQGAQDVGLRGVWINRYMQTAPPECQPDAVITDLTNVTTLIDEMRTKAS